MIQVGDGPFGTPNSLSYQNNYNFEEVIPDYSDQQLRVKAVEEATTLYAQKLITNVGEFNIKFMELVNQIYQFTNGSNSEKV